MIVICYSPSYLFCTTKIYYTILHLRLLGDAGDAFYMISKGRVTVQQSGLFSGAVELVKLGPGKYFGELALIEDAPRKATVVALESVSCWTVDRENFLNIFGR